MSTEFPRSSRCRVAVLLLAILAVAEGFSPCTFTQASNSLAGRTRETLIPRTVLFSDVSEPAETAEEEEASEEEKPVVKRERHTLFVGNIDFDTNDDELRDLFSQSGTVELVSIPVNKMTGQPRGFAFVDMSSAEECDKAIESLGGSSFKERTIRVSKSLPKEDVKKQNFKREKLYVGNLPFEVTKEDLIGVFEKYGSVWDCYLPMYQETGEPRGFAFVTLDEENAEKAIEELNGMELHGRPLVVNKPLAPGEKPARRQRTPRQKLYIGNLSFYTVADTLKEVFEEFGEVYDCYLPEDPESGGSRGFGFITLDKDAAQDAIRATDGMELDGRTIRVNEAQGKGFRKRNNYNNEDDGYEP